MILFTFSLPLSNSAQNTRHCHQVAERACLMEMKGGTHLQKRVVYGPSRPSVASVPILGLICSPSENGR